MLTTLILLGSALQMVPVWDGRRSPPESVKGERCNVAEIRRAQRVKVRSGPGRQYNETDMLAAGTAIFTCNEARDHKDHYWVSIVYRARGKPCDGAKSNGLDIWRSGRCRSGWVDSRWVETLSG